MEAIDRVKKRLAKKLPMFDLIATDYYMPICDGMDASRQIRAAISSKDPTNQNKAPYICLLTANDATGQLIKKARKHGVDEVLEKPVFKAAAQRMLVKAKLLFYPE